MSVFAYFRVSTLAQVEEGESLEVQQRQIEGYALMHGLTVDEIDRSRRACPVRCRSRAPGGAALFARLKSGDIVIAAKLDRLFRRRSTLCRWSRR